jgi:hypothetical protein
MILGLALELMLALLEIDTKAVDWASETLGLAWSANIAPQPDTIYVKCVAMFGGNQSFQVIVALVGAAAARPAKAGRDPEDMDVHRQNIEAERVQHHAFSDLVGNARQLHEVSVCRSVIPRAQSVEAAAAEIVTNLAQGPLYLPGPFPGQTSNPHFAFQGANGQAGYSIPTASRLQRFENLFGRIELGAVGEHQEDEIVNRATWVAEAGFAESGQESFAYAPNDCISDMQRFLPDGCSGPVIQPSVVPLPHWATLYDPGAGSNNEQGQPCLNSPQRSPGTMMARQPSLCSVC